MGDLSVPREKGKSDEWFITITKGRRAMIKNRNLWCSKATNSSRDVDRYLSLPEIATASLATAATANEGAIVYDATTNTVKFSDGSSWTNVATGGAAENAFATIDCPTGTDPVADSATDTLTLTQSDDTVVVTGTVASDTVDFKVGANLANANLAADAGIVLTKLAALTRGSVISGQTASNVPTALDAKGSKYILLGDGTDIASVEWTGDIAITTAGVTSFNGAIIDNADINASAGIVFTKLATLTRGSILTGQTASNVVTALAAKTSGYVLVGDGTDVNSVEWTGDITLSTAGVSAIGAGVIVNADVNGSAAIAESKLAFDTSAGHDHNGVNSKQVNVGTASVIAANATLDAVGAFDYTVALTAPAATRIITIPDPLGNDEFVFKAMTQILTNKEITAPDINGGTANALTSLSIRDTSAAFDVVLAATSSPVLDANRTITIDCNNTAATIALTGNVSLAGTLTTTGHNLTVACGAAARTLTLAGDLNIAGNVTTTIGTVALAADAGGSSALTLPATGTVATLAGSESLSSKTLAAPKIATTDGIFDAAGAEYVIFTEGGTPITYIGIHSANTLTAPEIRGEGETNTDLLLAGSGTGNVYIGDGADTSKDITFELVGATTAKTMTITSSHSDDRTLTLPNATDTLVGKATVDVLTNKTLDCTGTGNVVTNVNVKELDPVGDAATGVTFVVSKLLANNAAAGTNILTTHKKLRVIDVWWVDTTGHAGTVAVHAGQVGAVGNAISSTITSTTTDKALIRATTLDDAEWDVAEDGGLVAVSDAGASIDGVIFVQCMRID